MPTAITGRRLRPWPRAWPKLGRRLRYAVGVAFFWRPKPTASFSGDLTRRQSRRLRYFLIAFSVLQKKMVKNKILWDVVMLRDLVVRKTKKLESQHILKKVPSGGDALHREGYRRRRLVDVRGCSRRWDHPCCQDWRKPTAHTILPLPCALCTGNHNCDAGLSMQS
jgi:hypothetical protein